MYCEWKTTVFIWSEQKHKQQDNDCYSIHKHQTGRNPTWLRLPLPSPYFSFPDLSFRSGVCEPAWAEYKSNCVVSLLDNHFCAAIYMDIFFNVNVIRKYKQGSNLAQNPPKENSNKETSTTQKTRGASSYSKEEWWSPGDSRCVGPAMIFILFDKRCFLKKEKELCVEVSTSCYIMNGRPNSALAQICFIHPCIAVFLSLFHSDSQQVMFICLSFWAYTDFSQNYRGFCENRQ